MLRDHLRQIPPLPLSVATIRSHFRSGRVKLQAPRSSFASRPSASNFFTPSFSYDNSVSLQRWRRKALGNSEQFCSETIRLKSSSSPFGIHRRVDGTLISVDPFLLSLHPHFFPPRNVAAVGGSIVRRRVGLIPFWIQSFSHYCCGGFCGTLQPKNPSPNILLWHGPNHAYHVGLRAAVAEIAALRPPQRTSVRGPAGPGIFFPEININRTLSLQ